MCVVGAGGDSRNSSAVFISNTQVECQVAARPSQNSSFHVVSASMTSKSLVLSFRDPYGLHLNSTVFPTMLHSLGGTVITIASAYSICKDCQVFCDFRGIQVPSVRLMSSNRFTCQSPPVSEGSLPLPRRSRRSCGVRCANNCRSCKLVGLPTRPFPGRRRDIAA
jgi:hypothetical protein